MMGEAIRVNQFGPQARINRPSHNPQPIQVDLKNAIPRECKCGCAIFIQGVKLYTISALVSPTGQELIAQQPVLVCKNCGEVAE
jgi:hypothetical protein